MRLTALAVLARSRALRLSLLAAVGVPTHRGGPLHPAGAGIEVQSQSAARSARSDSVVGVFEGRTPCSAIALDFTGFPSSGCAKI